MVYKAIGLMSGSSLDGLDIAYVHLHETGGGWNYELLHTDCYAYPADWMEKLANATHLSALDYQLLHTAYGHYTGELVNKFIHDHSLHHQVHLVASHGHTSFHVPTQRMTAQLGDGAAIAAETGLPVVSDLRSLDIAFGGQGAPIVPVGEKLLLPGYKLFLNLGGIANLSFNQPGQYTAFDVCPANRILNQLLQGTGKAFDDEGKIASGGTVQPALLNELNQLAYYGLAFPKSLSNDFGTDTVFPLVKHYALSVQDALRTYVEHIAQQVGMAAGKLLAAGIGETEAGPAPAETQLLITGGGAFNRFMVERIGNQLMKHNITPVVPDKQLVNYKEALVMALIGVLRWREEYNVYSSVTGAARSSINGALWLGGEA
ncbi:MAG: anhydro-N-acetylmuramic acid kinase [Bacteroidota bacterium]